MLVRYVVNDRQGWRIELTTGNMLKSASTTWKTTRCYPIVVKVSLLLCHKSTLSCFLRRRSNSAFPTSVLRRLTDANPLLANPLRPRTPQHLESDARGR